MFNSERVAVPCRARERIALVNFWNFIEPYASCSTFELKIDSARCCSKGLETWRRWQRDCQSRWLHGTYQKCKEIGIASEANKCQSNSSFRKTPEDSKSLSSQLQINWRLYNFNREFVNKVKFKEHIESQPFELMAGKIKTKWLISFYPSGASVENCFAIFVNKKEESSQNYEFGARFSLVNGEKKTHTMDFKKQNASSLELDYGRGFYEFITHEEFFKRFDEFVTGNQLLIRVELSMTAPKTEAEAYFSTKLWLLLLLWLVIKFYRIDCVVQCFRITTAKVTRHAMTLIEDKFERQSELVID